MKRQNKNFSELLLENCLEVKDIYREQEVASLLNVKSVKKLISAGYLDSELTYDNVKGFIEVTQGYLNSHRWLRATEAVKVIGVSPQAFYGLVKSRSIRTSMNPVSYQTMYHTEDVVKVAEERLRTSV